MVKKNWEVEVRDGVYRKFDNAEQMIFYKDGYMDGRFKRKNKFTNEEWEIYNKGV